MYRQRDQWGGSLQASQRVFFLFPLEIKNPNAHQSSKLNLIRLRRTGCNGLPPDELMVQQRIRREPLPGGSSLFQEHGAMEKKEER